MSDRQRTRPVLVYDGDCGICTRSVEWAERHLTRDVDVVAFQDADLDALGLTRQQCERAVQWVARDGQISSAHHAVGELLAASGRRWLPLAFLARTPPFSWVAGACYRWVAANRHRLPGGTPACSLPPHLRPGSGQPPAG